MSTVKAINLQHPNSSNINMVLGADGSVSGGLPSPNRNLLYNGAMQVAQRSSSVASITTSGYYTADRWATECTSGGTWTQTVENDGPTGSGVTKSLKMLCTTASSSLGAAAALNILQKIEGQDVQRIAKGTSSAQQLMLSFWTKANVTGTYTILIYENTNNRSISLSYSISASATWEKKTVLIPSDTTGTITNNNGSQFEIFFCLAAGSNQTSGTLQTTWGTYSAVNRAVGQVNLASAINNYWQITGVQLEVGPAPTPFEFKPYAQELRECQRYFVAYYNPPLRGVASGTTALNRCSANMPVPMRTTPGNPTISGTLNWFDGTGVGTIVNSNVNFWYMTPTTVELDASTVTTGTTSIYRPIIFYVTGSSGTINISAEL